MNNHANNSTCTDASGTSLRPVFKPIRTHMSRAFLRQFAKTNLVSLVNNINRVFLRLGFDGYSGENTPDGFQLRLSGNNLNTGRYCDHHVVYKALGALPCALTAKFQDHSQYYMLSLDLADLSPLPEAA